MLGSAKVVKAVADFLAEASFQKPVWELCREGPDCPTSFSIPFSNPPPVPIFWTLPAPDYWSKSLFPWPTSFTPNIDEAEALTGIKVRDLDEMKAAAAKLHEMGAKAMVITGGHLDKAIDLLSFTMTRNGVPDASRGGETNPPPEQEVFKAERQRSNSTHGTGCAFATAMACHLALDRGLAEAALLAKTYVTAAIANGHPLGRGTDPVNRLYRMGQQRRAVGSGNES